MTTCPQYSMGCNDTSQYCHVCGTMLERPLRAAAGSPFVGCTLRGGYVIRELIAEGRGGVLA